MLANTPPIRRRQRHARRFAYAMGGIVCFIVVLGIAAAFALSSGYARDKIGASLSAHLGRGFSIEGPLSVQWHWDTLDISARGIKIKNAPGGTAPDMVDIAGIEATLRYWQLFAGRLDISSLHVEAPHILLEKTDDTHANWDFPALSSANVAAHAALPSSRRNFPLIGHLRIEDGLITYRDVPKKLDMTLQMKTAKGHERSSESFSFSGSGTLDGQAFTMKMDGGSLEMLRDSGEDFPLALELDVGLTKVTINGTFQDPVQLKGLKADLSMQGANLANLFYLTHIPLPPTPPYTLSGKLEKQGDKWSFENFNGKVGNSDLEGNLVYDTSGKRGLLTGNLNARRLDVADLGGFIGEAPKGEKLKNATPSQKKLAQQEAASPNLLPDVPLDLTRLRASDIDMDFNADKLNAPGWPLSDMKTHISLTNGLLRIDPLAFGVAGGTVDGMIELDGRQDTPAVKTDLNLRKLSLKQFFTSEKFKDLSTGHFGGHIALAGTGTSLAKALASSNGRLVVLMSGGRISLLLIQASDLDIAKTVPALILGKDKTTDIRCAVGDFNVKDGLLTSQAFVFDTTASNLKGDATIDLENEKINATIGAHPKDKSLLALQSKILITGSLKHPSVMIDPLSTGVRGGSAVLLAVLNPLAAILPFIELGLGKDSDCRALIQNSDNGPPITK